jgi:hypothetical protein
MDLYPTCAFTFLGRFFGGEWFANCAALDADMVASGNVGCLLQLQSALFRGKKGGACFTTTGNDPNLPLRTARSSFRTKIKGPTKRAGQKRVDYSTLRSAFSNIACFISAFAKPSKQYGGIERTSSAAGSDSEHHLQIPDAFQKTR